MLRACKGAQSTQHAYSARGRTFCAFCARRSKFPSQRPETRQLPMSILGLVQTKHLVVTILMMQIDIPRICLFNNWNTKTPESCLKSSLGPPNNINHSYPILDIAGCYRRVHMGQAQRRRMLGCRLACFAARMASSGSCCRMASFPCFKSPESVLLACSVHSNLHTPVLVVPKGSCSHL